MELIITQKQKQKRGRIKFGDYLSINLYINP